MAATTRLGLSATPRAPYGSFAGKTPEGVGGRVIIKLAGKGGLAGPGGLAGTTGGLAK